MFARLKMVTLALLVALPSVAVASANDAVDDAAVGPVAGGSEEQAARSASGSKKSSSRKSSKKSSSKSKSSQSGSSKSGSSNSAPTKSAPTDSRGDASRAAPRTDARERAAPAPTRVKVQTGSNAAPGGAVGASTDRRAAPAHHAAASNFRSRTPSGAAPANNAMAGHRPVAARPAAVASHRHAVSVSRHRAVIAGNHRAWNSRHRAAYRHRSWSYRAPHARWYHPWAPGRPHYWYHGVFVYGPRPVVVVPGRGGPPVEAQEPEREIDRTGQMSVGIRGGSYMSRYTLGGTYGDLGLGLAARYRAAEALGFELQWQHHDQSWTGDSERAQDPISASVEVFAFPWSRVNPYLLAGVTATPRDIQDQVGNTTVTTGATLWGPHGGLGLEIGVGENASINADARWVGYINRAGDDASYPGAFQGNLGVNFYF